MFLIDSHFRVVPGGRGVGKLDVSQPPGIYTVRLRAGDGTDEHMILVEDADVDMIFAPVAFSSPVLSDPDVAKSAAAAAPPAMAVPADGGSIFVCATAKDSDPLAGLVLQDQAGREVAALSAGAIVQQRSNAGTVRTYTADLGPGLYRLGLAVESVGVLTQTVIVSKGWRTNIFLREAPYPVRGKQTLRADMVGAAMLLSRLDRPTMTVTSPEARLVELARLALKNRRNVLSTELMETLLYGKFDDPMMGIFGGHLILLSPKRDLELLGVVVTNLRRLVGTAHPDVEALAYALDPPQSSYTFTVPPMLRLSWELALVASASRPDVIPAGSVAARAADRIWGEEPWLIWNQQSTVAPTTGGAAAAPTESDIVQERLWELVQYAAVRFPDSPLGRVAAGAVAGGLAALARGGPNIPTVVQKSAGYLDDLWGLATAFLRSSPTSKLDTKDVERLVRRLGIPRSVLDKALQDLRRTRPSSARAVNADAASHCP